MKSAMLSLFATCILFASASAQEAGGTPQSKYSVSQQDATVVAPQNYKVELENDLVRVIRVTYAPHEKSLMHEHQGNAAVIIVLRGGGRMHQVNSDGTTVEGNTEKAGAVRFVPARSPFKHASENVTDYPLETIRVELKTPLCGGNPNLKKERTSDTPLR
jgi:quercetin dioxygenase-like cupin family protein